nr:hypothetical protein [Tanacetum cinerariifolium]
DYLEEFSSKLAHINPEITESDFDYEEEIRLIENLLYDNSSPRSPEELNAEIANTIVESFPSLPIPVQDGDSQREEIDIVTETDDVLPLSKMSYPTMRHPILITHQFHDLLRNHQMLSFNFEPDSGEEILVVMNAIRDEFDVSNDENDDYCSFMFVI